LIEPHDRRAVGAIAKGFAIMARDVDLVADGDIFQKPEMGVAMRRVDGDADLAGFRGALQMAGPESQRLTA
jgi:hypothetical protein